MALGMTAPSIPDFEAMTKKEIIEFGHDHGIEGLNRHMKKAEIIATIKGAMGWI